MPSLGNLVGQRFGRLVVASREPGTRTKRGAWVCRCDCGETLRADTQNLKNGRTRSCGCYRRECGRNLGRSHLVHGHTKGGRETPEFHAWTSAKDRCYNPKNRMYKHYGGRGICMCPQWEHDFQAFFSCVGTRPSPKHSLDRKNNDGNYEPGNCRWATAEEQLNNRRYNKWLTCDGVKRTQAQWARVLGVTSTMICGRLKAGWSEQQALSSPFSHNNRTRLVTFKGKTQTLSAWAREVHLPASTLHSRLEVRGWSVKRALTTPPIPPRLRRAHVSGRAILG